MNFIPKIALAALGAFGISMAAYKDLYFNPKFGDDGCMTEKYMQNWKCTEKKSTWTAVGMTSPAPVRLRVIDPPEMESTEFGIYLERPFFIIDGIHLSTDETRSLQQFHAETEEFGIPEILTSLGYTPVLVQFSQTVTTSLEKNSSHFAALLKYLNDNAKIPFPGKNQDGFVVLGISQGGILGRYGAYLYDKDRKSSDAPVRLYASLDSPHQGAVMPRGLVATIDFWASEAGVAAAEAFNDLVSSPGARDLLIYDTNAGNGTYEPKMGADRFLFGDYRKAATYKGFPQVLVAQGQLKGTTPTHSSTYFKLNRYAEKGGSVWGRAQSEMYAKDKTSGKYAHNHMYQFPGDVSDTDKNGVTKFDFVQGSTYPFAQTMYEALREGIVEAIPNKFEKDIKAAGISWMSLSFYGKWDEDSLYQKNSTFIPTVSAMDMQCSGDLAIKSDCAFSQNSSGFAFENAGAKSTAKAAYAVDPTHPRYKEAISGRHIESPVKGTKIDQTVLKGMQTDVWRVLCELSKVDYDSTKKSFRNPKLGGMFAPNTSCMDQSKMPEVIKNGGILQTKKFNYARYAYNAEASEKNEIVSFDLPAGWNYVSLWDNGTSITPGSMLEVDAKVESPKSNWMKADLVLMQTKNGAGHLQLTEQEVKQDGLFHTLRWQMPSAASALTNYRWFRLVLNSSGAKVTLANPRIVTSAIANTEMNPAIPSATLYPNNSYSVVPWSDTVVVKNYSDAMGSGLKMSYGSYLDGMHFELKKTYSMDAYKNLVVEYWPGTCQSTTIFFGNKTKNVNLGNGSLQGSFVTKKLPLSDLVNVALNPNQPYSASRLSLQAMKSNETCIVHSIRLE